MSKLTAIAEELRAATKELDEIGANIGTVQDERDRLYTDYERVEERIQELKKLLVSTATAGE